LFGKTGLCVIIVGFLHDALNFFSARLYVYVWRALQFSDPLIDILFWAAWAVMGRS
jgi:hypothetical protein